MTHYPDGIVRMRYAIKAINSLAEFMVPGTTGLPPGAHPSGVDNIIWHNGTTPIDRDVLLAKQAELQAEYDALAYARKRKKEYPSLNEFAEAYAEKEIGDDSTKWDAYIINYNKVRTENPK